ncbi:laccase domain-containing protein [Psychrobacter frigidicola]|uniref:Laccase domain-containing protein n=1 Tax=Psychrobacter frigidicola TaxID=45611 RepID=A0A5C7A5D8_9GAMM|nr:polyphenol oxidase family protein [Psychrobacter frigidicola]TXD97734.1 laccase domain-containing protein [Psychrobacter frigidicola]
MTNKFPITMLAQLGDVTVFQTAAFTDVVADTTTESLDADPRIQNIQQMRQAGQSSYGEFNLGLHVNDDAAKVLNNRMRLLSYINEQLAIQQRLPIKSLHWVNQVHGQQIHDVNTTRLSMRPVDADAIISQQDDLSLAIMTADCVPIVLYQPASGKIAAIHAGWQGLACGVIRATAECFTAAGRIMAWIGVSISQTHYEVGHQVQDKLLTGCIENQLLSAAHIHNFDSLFSIPSSAHPDTNAKDLHNTVDKLSTPATVTTDKVQLDLPKLAAYQLIDAGITVCSDAPYPCSYADMKYYSYRRQTHLRQPATGRMALVIVRSSSAAIAMHN